MGAYNKIVLNETDNSILNNVSNSTVSKEMEKFNNSYNAEKVKDIFEAYENVSVAEEDLKDNVLVKNNVFVDTNESISFKHKLFFIGAGLICSIMLFLAVFNLFVINGTTDSINILQDNIASETKTYNDLYKDWSTATNNSKIEAELAESGYSSVMSENVSKVEVGKIVPVIKPSGETNWFDAFCNFISSIFGR